MSKIIVFREKHGDRYFDALINKACLKIVRERFAEGWYEVDTEPKKPDFDKKSIATLPESFRKAAIQEYQYYEKEFAKYLKSKEIHGLALKATEGDCKAAYKINNIKGEYSEYEILSLEKV